MPFRDRYQSAKDSLKRRIGKGSVNSSSISLLGTTHSQNPGSAAHPGIPQSVTSTPAPPVGASSLAGAWSNASGNIVPTGTALPAATTTAPAAISPELPSQGPASTGNTQSTLGRTRVTARSGLKALLQVLNSNSNAFPPLRSAVDRLHDCLGGASHGRKDFEALHATLDSLLGDLSGYIGGASGPKMTLSMKNLCIGLENEMKMVQEKAVRGPLQRHTEALEDCDEIMESYRRIQGYLERLAMNANLSTWEIITSLEAGTRLQKLSPTMSAVYNSAESEEIQRGPCTQGTREDELVKLVAWARDKIAKTEDIYWINGMAGTGKTTIAYSLCAELEKSARLGASFFCSRLLPECRNVKLIIPSISYQLAHYSQPFRYSLSRVLEADPNVHTRVLKTQFESLIVKPLLEVKHTLPTDFVVVIDALDECENEYSIGHILDTLLSQPSSIDLPVRFLLSSRPEPDIYSRMMARVGTNHNARLVLHELDVGRVKKDIETYLQAELKDVHLTSSQLAALVANSGVLFIYASTVCRYIKDGLRLKQHEKRLKMVLGLEPASADGKHRNIDRLYTSILTAAFGSNYLDEMSRIQMKVILDTAICAQEPMTVGGIAGLIGLPDGDQVDALLRPLCSVINITETSGLVTTLHSSFPDFMFDNHRASLFHCNPHAVHTTLTQRCFEVIQNNDPQFNICAIGSSYLRDDDVPGLIERVEQVVSPQMFYACRYWATHLALGTKTNETVNPMHDFLSERLLLWMEVLNLKKSMYLGPGIIQRMEIWAQRNGCSREILDLAHDAWRFASMYAGHAVSQSTPHIYTSMLPFWPASAPITKIYTSRTQDILQAQGTAMSRRELALVSTWAFEEDLETVSYSPDGSLIAYAADAAVFLIDGTTGRAVLGPLENHGKVRAIAYSPDGQLLVSGSNNKALLLWNTSDGQTINEPFVGHTDNIRSVCFSPSGTQIISGSDDKTLRVWDVKTGQTVVGPLEGHGGAVLSLCISPDGACIASGSVDKTLRLWDTKSGHMVLDPFKGHTGSIWSVSFSPDGRSVVSGSGDNTIRMWSTRNARMISGPFEGPDKVYSVMFSPDGKHVVSGSRDDTVRLWSVSDGSGTVRALKGHTDMVVAVGFSSDGTRIVSCGDDKTIRVWDAQGQGPSDSSLQGHTDAVTTASFSQDNCYIVSASNDATICIWDRPSGQPVGEPLKGHSNWVNHVCFAPNNSLIASCSKDRTVRLWDIQSRSLVREPLTGHSGGVLSVCFSPDGTRLASSSDDCTIRFWDLQSGEPVGRPLTRHTNWIRSLCYSPDGLTLVSGADDRSVVVWDIESSEAIHLLYGHTQGVWAVCISPDGTRIASGSMDMSVRLWDTQSGQLLFGPLHGHTGRVRSLCFSPESRYIFSVSEDKTIRRWDVQSGQEVGSPLIGHTQVVRSVAFSLAGDCIVTGSDDATIRVWDIADLVGVTMGSFSGPNSVRPNPSTHEAWTLQEDGWVTNSQNDLLAWVPPDLHPALMTPRNTLLISTKGSFRLDFEHAKLGESWTGCYIP